MYLRLEDGPEYVVMEVLNINGRCRLVQTVWSNRSFFYLAYNVKNVTGYLIRQVRDSYK